MATLLASKIKDTYKSLLKMATSGNNGIDGTFISVEDGDATASTLQLSTAGVKSTGTFDVTGVSTLAAVSATTGTFSSTLGVTGASTLADINSSGVMTNTSTNGTPFRATGATTGNNVLRMSNTGGDAMFGIENSVGGNNLIVGATGYDAIVRGATGIAFSANAGSAMQMRLSSTGLAVAGTLGVTGATTLSSTLQSTNIGINYAPQTDRIFIYNGSGATNLITAQQDGTGDLIRLNGNSGANRFAITQAGAVTIPGTLGVTGVITAVGNTTGGIKINDASGNQGATIHFLGSSTTPNWQVGNQCQSSNAFTVTPSTTNGGTTFTTPALTIIGTTSNVGIGTVAPYNKLQVSKNISETSAIDINSTAILKISNPNNTTGNHSLIQFSANDNDISVLLGSKLVNSGNGDSAFVIGVRGSGGTLSEKMRIDSSGNVGIGHTAPGIVAGAAKYLTLATAQTNGAGYGSLEILGATTQNNVASKIDFINFRDNANYNIARITATVGTSSVDQGALGFWTNPSGGLVERMTISQAGAVTIASGQITFPASQNASADANTLDDYEEGTWTPNIVGATSGSVTMTSTTSVYVKIGRQVTVYVNELTWTAKTTLVGNVLISGLPFTVASSRSVGGLGVNNGGFSSVVIAAANVDVATTYAFLINKATTNNSYTHMLDANINATGTIYGFTITYVI